MSKGGEAPTAVNPTVAAGAQTASNIATADANRTNSTSPVGSSTWSQGPDGRWTQNTSLDPSLTPLTDLGGTLAKQASNVSAMPLNIGGANADYLAQGPQPLINSATEAYYNKQKSFLDPQWGQTENELTDKLSRQGIPVGSDAYNRSMTNFNNSKTQAYDAARSGAVGQGIQGANTMFNMAALGQNQSIASQQAAQQNPLKLISMLYGGGTGVG